MKPITKILIVILCLITLIPIKWGMFCWFSQSDTCGFFGLKTLNPDIEKLFFLLGGFVLGSFALITAVFQILAIVWIYKGKAEGFFFSTLVGCISIVRGIVMFTLLEPNATNDIRMSALPIIVGSVIIVLTVVASRKEMSYY